jgi:hypothetical protein
VIAQLGQDKKTEMKTPTIGNGGSDAVFDYLDLKVAVTTAALQSVITYVWRIFQLIKIFESIPFRSIIASEIA